MTSNPQQKPSAAGGDTSEDRLEPTGVPGGSYDLDPDFIKEHGGEQALEDGEKPKPGL